MVKSLLNQWSESRLTIRYVWMGLWLLACILSFILVQNEACSQPLHWSPVCIYRSVPVRLGPPQIKHQWLTCTVHGVLFFIYQWPPWNNRLNWITYCNLECFYFSQHLLWFSHFTWSFKRAQTSGFCVHIRVHVQP